ncbi:MAG: hypothetical protein JWM91_76 [Rhodospirillales bacterium]|nr:hypothetical protein [Rhodospirillales bacterium]
MTQIEMANGILLTELPTSAGTPPRLVSRLATSRFAAAAYRRTFIETLKRRQFGIAGALINTRHGCPGYFRFVVGSGVPDHQTVIQLEFRRDNCILELNPHLMTGARLDFVAYRLLALFTLFAGCRDAPNGTISLNLDDYGIVPGLTFSDARPDRWLIPDPVFLMENAYRRTAQHYLQHHVPWSERHKIGFWRGATTGDEVGDGNWEMLDRVRLCRIAANHPTLFDAGLAGVVQLNEADTAAVNASGLVRNFVPETQLIEYRYQIDIDGNTNSWPGLFQKLLTGSPVLKVASRHGHRQWYYDRLVPWQNFVPVASDISDLVEKLNWLIRHDAEAQRIGAAGRALALSMTIPVELQRARATICAALNAATA